MSKIYKLREDGMQWHFQKSRSKIQLIGGGYGNGKTTSAVVKALMLARDYPGSNGLIARATFPKLNDTIRKEFVAWCPKSWIKRKNFSTDNVIELHNGTVINFRYVQQGGKSAESSTSNLLSASYDWIVIDQIEDPEITHKDFLDLLGRLRGQTVYQGDDETMPSTGPRWLIAMCNPTRNWVYKQLVKPYHDWKAGIPNDLLIRDEHTGEVLIEVFEGSTYENAENLPEDYIKLNEATYRGQMRKRFLLGEWGAYEGLVYPEYNSQVHMIDHDLMLDYFEQLRGNGAYHNTLEAYDHGIAVPACYGFGFVDRVGNVFLLDGYYEKEKTVAELAAGIKKIRKEYDIEAVGLEEYDPKVWADPAIFKRTSGSTRTVGTTVAGLFREEGVKMVRGNNDIISGVAKVQSYLYSDPFHRHPIDEDKVGAPRFFVSKNLSWFENEISDYYWKRNATTQEYEDTPRDRNDHAMDMLKYMFSNRPRVATFLMPKPVIKPKYRQWRENESPAEQRKQHRYA